MHNRAGLLEAALDALCEGMVLLDGDNHVAFWNQAATELTGYRAADVIDHPCPAGLYEVDEEHRSRSDAAEAMRAESPQDLHAFAGAVAGYSNGLTPVHEPIGEGLLERPTLVTLRHRLGHGVPAMLRRLPLHDALGHRIGTSLIFYTAAETAALPHGETTGGAGIERSQAGMEDRLDEAQHQWTANRSPFGLLWITIDQAAPMRRTHGREACESMLRTMEETLLRLLKPGETLGRWGDSEFLVLSHERSLPQLAAHAERLAGLARTADFRWWGDRITLTASIGAGYAQQDEGLPALLERTRQAMQKSLSAGGNHVSETRGR